MSRAFTNLFRYSDEMLNVTGTTANQVMGVVSSVPGIGQFAGTVLSTGQKLDEILNGKKQPVTGLEWFLSGLPLPARGFITLRAKALGEAIPEFRAYNIPHPDINTLVKADDKTIADLRQKLIAAMRASGRTVATSASELKQVYKGQVPDSQVQFENQLQTQLAQISQQAEQKRQAEEQQSNLITYGSIAAAVFIVILIVAS